MLIQVKSEGFTLTKGLRNFVETRMRFILTRYGARITKVDVTLLDADCPVGGKEPVCRVKLHLKGSKAIMIEEGHADLYEAVTNVGLRLKRAIVRQFERFDASPKRF